MSICLIVEDSEIIREIAARIVQNLGLEAVDADGAGPALERCRAESVAVVLLDWDLPAMGALDFLRGAAALDEAARPEIILCATENDEKQFTLARAAGAAHHLLKPYDQATVAAKFLELGLIEADKIAAVGGAGE